jgi:hypothetical protein
MLYFFHGKQAIVVSGLKKEDSVPLADIELAVTRRAVFEKSPAKHSYRG